MVSYKLTYFDGRGAAEIIRQVFVLASQNFTDVRMSHEDNALRTACRYLKLTESSYLSPMLSFRYLARKFGFAGKSDWDEAQVDAIADQFKDFLNDVRPYFKIVMGMDKGDLETAAKEIFEPARQKYFEQFTKILKQNKSAMPFGQLPVLEVDGKQLPQSYAIVRYLARKFGFAGKSDWDEAQVDAIADQFKDFLNDVRPYFKIVMGMDKGDLETAAKEIFEPARQKYFEQFTKILKQNKSGYLVGDSITFADLYLAEMATFTDKFPKLYDGFPEMKAHAEKVRSNPKLKKWLETRPQTNF
ncbi:glutathione S-transferase protein [Cooperia oncophora]